MDRHVLGICRPDSRQMPRSSATLYAGQRRRTVSVSITRARLRVGRWKLQLQVIRRQFVASFASVQPRRTADLGLLKFQRWNSAGWRGSSYRQGLQTATNVVKKILEASHFTVTRKPSWRKGKRATAVLYWRP